MMVKELIVHPMKAVVLGELTLARVSVIGGS
jgi:hypothetical protein